MTMPTQIRTSDPSSTDGPSGLGRTQELRIANAASHRRVCDRAQPISIEDVPHILPYQSVSTSRGLGWDGITVDVYRPLASCSDSYRALNHHLVCYSPSGHARLVQARCGTVHEGSQSAGTTLLMPAGLDATWEGDMTATARLRVRPEHLLSAAEQIGRHAISQVELRNVFQERDAMIEKIALMFTAELERPRHPAQRLLADALSSALAAHLLHCYNAFEAVEAVQPPPLGRIELAKLTEYIEDNIDHSIGLAELAAIVNVSRFHFSRLFKRSTGETAIAFVEQCRIRRAQALLAETEAPLAEVALMTGFADQSHFTRRFHLMVGCTPARFARDQGMRRSTRRFS